MKNDEILCESISLNPSIQLDQSHYRMSDILLKPNDNNNNYYAMYNIERQASSASLQLTHHKAEHHTYNLVI